MRETRKPTYIGILLTVSGAIPLTVGLIVGIYLLPIRPLFPSMLASIFLVFAGIFPLVGAVCSFKRRFWTEVVASCIAATFAYLVLIITIPLLFFVVAALILTLLSREEFD